MDRLQEILRTMDVPKTRMRDIPWLMRNLGIRNSGNPSYAEARWLLVEKFHEWVDNN